MAIPAPPNRLCRRFAANGTRCTNRTTRGDGWCGSCDGYSTAHADRAEHNNWRWGLGTWTPATLGMDSDEAYEIDIAPLAVATYTAVHGVDAREAETQIRSLLEDLITEQAVTETNEAGSIRVYFRNYGYGLLISDDRAHVLRYATRHRERTWAQFRAGVPSRTSERGPGGMPAWKKQALDAHTPLPVADSALNMFARHILGTKITRDNVDDVAERLGAHLREHVMPQWDRGEEQAIDDGHGTTFVIVRRDHHPDGLIATLYATDPAPLPR